MNKGMPFWEQHVEKIVLGLTVAVLLAVFAMLILGNQSITAEIDGQKYGPAEVDQVLVDKAQELGRRLGPDAVVDVSAFESIRADGSSGFVERLDASVGPDGTPPRIAPALAASLLPEGVGSVDVWYHEPRIPAPRMRTRVVQTIDTVETSEFDRLPELSSRLNGDSDVAWTTPVAMIDLVAVRAELAKSDDSADPSRATIPSNWFNERPYVLDVVFEREMQTADGGWTELEVVDPIPGGIGLRDVLAQKRADDELDAGFKETVWLNLDDRVNQLEILQPDFFATTNAALAISQDEPEEQLVDDNEGLSEQDIADREQERELRRRIRDRQASAGRISATLTNLGGPLTETEDEDDRKGGNSGRGGAGGGRGGGRGGGGGASDPNGGGDFGMGGSAGRKSGGSMASEADRRRRIGLTKKLNRLMNEIERLESQLSALNPEAKMESETGDQAELKDLATADELLVWAHDLGVEPGKTYRYRCRILMFNPFFARGRQLLPDQQGLAASFEIASAVSEWSSPVQVAPPVEFFVVRASDGEGSLGMGEARIELYRYEDGARRTEQFTVQPGERIGRKARVGDSMVDFQTDWYLVDVIDDPAADGRAGVDAEDDATVICRRLDGTERRIQVPSQQIIDPQRTRLRVDADGASG